jgi:OOP family OmpA-OmpF porin
MKRIIIALASILTTSTTIAAETSQFEKQVFMGIKSGYTLADDNTYRHSAPNSIALGIYGGIQFSPDWSANIGYQKQGSLKASATNVEVETWLIESALRYDWPFTTSISLYGRIGAAYWEMDKLQKSSATNEQATGFSPLTEAGISYAFNPVVKVSAGYQYIDAIGKKETTGQYDNHTIFLNIAYTFSSTSERKE